MNSFPWPDVLVIAGLIFINGVFAMSELAIVSARPARLRVAAERGSRGARTALALAADPGKLLSTAQTGITLIGIIAGAFSGSSLGGPIGERLQLLGLPADWAPETGFAIAIALTTYFSLVVGELVPKQMALRSAEKIAILTAPAMALLSRAAAPMVWLLNRSSAALLRLTGVTHKGDHALSAEELQMIFAEATRSGVIEEDERQIMTGIMRLADRPVRELMTPRTELDTIDRKASAEEVRAAIKDSPHSLLPVADGSPDNIVGVVKVKDVLAVLLSGRKLLLTKLMRKAEIIPDQLDAMDALRILQQSGVSMALVHDEYGHLEGVVTPADLLAAIVGNFASHQDEGDAPLLVVREDGSLLLAGALPVDALISQLGLELPDDRDYATAAGFALSVFKKLPHEGEHFTQQGWRFEVVDMDGRKIDKLLANRLVPQPASAA